MFNFNTLVNNVLCESLPILPDGAIDTAYPNKIDGDDNKEYYATDTLQIVGTIRIKHIHNKNIYVLIRDNKTAVIIQTDDKGLLGQYVDTRVIVKGVYNKEVFSIIDIKKL